MAQSWSEGSDGENPTYTERVWAPWWAWAVGPAMLVVLALAFGSAYGAGLGWGIWVVGTIAVTALLVANSPVLRVDERIIRAGRARLPRGCAGSPRVLDAADTERERRHGDARTFVVLRGWSAPQSVLIPVIDPEDPHPRWLVSTRRPEAFAAAIRGLPDRRSSAGDVAPG